jgi:hypothetical protein
VVGLLVAGGLMLAAPFAHALDVEPPGGIGPVEVHAFASQGLILSKDNQYLALDTTHGSLQFSELGVNLTRSFGERFRVGMQLFAQNLGPTGKFDVKADWFYLDYRFTNWLGVRAGRVKIPFGLYNDIVDIDSARNPVLLPQSVYPETNRNYLLAQTGGEVYGYVVLHDAGALDYRLYGGSIFLDTSSTSSPFQIASLNVPYLVGGRLLWETPLQGLRVGGSVQSLRLDANVLSSNPASVPVSQPSTAPASAAVQIPAVLWVGSLEYAASDLLFAAEYSRWYVSADSSNPSVFPPTPQMTSERAYAMVNYRATRWLQPGLYYSLLFPDVDQRSGREHQQHDIATTLRFDLNAHWLLKLEAHYMFGTAGVDPMLNGDKPLSALTQSWGVLLAKTTAYF